MRQEAPRRVGQSQPCRTLARPGAAQKSDGAAAEGRNQPQLRQPRPGSSRRSRDVRGEGAHPRQYRVRNSVTGPSPCRNIRQPETALNETKNPPSDEPPLLLEDLRKPLDIPRKAPCRPQTNDMVERSSLRVDLSPHLHQPTSVRRRLPDPAPPPQPPLTRHCPTPPPPTAFTTSRGSTTRHT